MNKAGTRKDLVGYIKPLNRIPGQRALRRSLGHRPGRGFAIQRDFAGEFPVAGPDIAGSGDGAIADVERVGSDTQAIGGGAKKDLPDFGTCVPDGAARLLYGKATGGDALIGTACRRGSDHPHAADIDIEFIGGDLGQCSHDALTDLDLSRRDHDVSVRREPYP